MITRKDVGKAFGSAALALTTALSSGHALAQEPVQTRASISQQEQNNQLAAASDAATAYAKGNYGVGIVMHVGTDLPSEAAVQKVGQYFVDQFAQRGVEARVFPSQNDMPNTGITYHVGHLIVGSGDGTEVQLIRPALNRIPTVVEQLEFVKSYLTSSADDYIPEQY